MRKGEFPDGAHVLRAKIDMASTNMKMRDPLLYRIRHSEHYRRGDAWCIYPFYDFTHCLSDALEDITHSICTLEFENNRELYDWVIDNVSSPARPRQYEFARLNLTYTVMSKRRLLELVENGHVSGWDDPRMPTISGLRRRGVTPEAIRTFCERIGVSKNNSTVDMALFEHFDARRSEHARAAGAVRAASAAAGDRKLAGGARGRARRAVLASRCAAARAADRCRFRACSTSIATISWKSRRKTSSVWRRGARFASGTPT